MCVVCNQHTLNLNHTKVQLVRLKLSLLSCPILSKSETREVLGMKTVNKIEASLIATTHYLLTI